VGHTIPHEPVSWLVALKDADFLRVEAQERSYAGRRPPVSPWSLRSSGNPAGTLLAGVGQMLLSGKERAHTGQAGVGDSGRSALQFVHKDCMDAFAPQSTQACGSIWRPIFIQMFKMCPAIFDNCGLILENYGHFTLIIQVKTSNGKV